jgi:phage gp46-like protein
MSDLALAWDPAAAAADLVLDGFDLAVDDGLRTAVIVSLFTDRRAELDDELPAGDGDRRGFWADSVAPPAKGDLTGSRIWLLDRGGGTADTGRKLENYAREALAWMIKDGVAASIDLVGSTTARGQLQLGLVIHRPTGPSRFDFVWDAL